MEEMESLRQKEEQERRLRIAAIAVIMVGIIGIGICGWMWFTRYHPGRRYKKQAKERHEYAPQVVRAFARLRQFLTTNKAGRGQEVIPAESTEQIETDKSRLHNEVLLVDLPADYYTPAELSVLLRGNKVTPRDMVATLIDLVVRRYLDVEAIEIDNGKSYLLSLRDFDPTSLKSHEEYLINWFLKDIGDGIKVCVKEIEQAACNPGIDIQFYNRFIIWKKLVLKQAARWKFNERATPFKFYRRTSFGKNHYSEWLRFKKTLQRVSHNANSVPLAEWERFLAYAFTLGIAKHIVKGLKVAFPAGTPLDDNLTVFNRYNFPVIDHWFDLTKRFDLVWNRWFRSIQRFTSLTWKIGQNRQRNM